MPFRSEAYLKSLPEAERARLLSMHTPFGHHPTTGDKWLVPTITRYSGTSIVGAQGAGKSRLAVNCIAHDVRHDRSVFVIDPHGDLTRDTIAILPKEKLARTYVLDMEDIDYPFGINVFSGLSQGSPIAQAKAIDRVMHCAEVLWPDAMSQQYLPRLLRAATIVLFANPGSSLMDMLPFLLNDTVRRKMLQAVQEPSVRRFWQDYNSLPLIERRQQITPLVNRLESLSLGRRLVSNLLGQRETSIDFRQAIENHEIIFIKLPLKTLAQDAKLIGIFLLAQIHAATFSFSDLPEEQRPGFSLFVDEFQHFATPDFAELFSEGRKFGARVCVSHQYREQLPDYLRHATATAATKVCFRSTPDDAREMAHFFLSGESSLRPEDIRPKPVEHLLQYGSENPTVQTFIDYYLRPLQSQKHGGQIEIRRPGVRWEHWLYWLLCVEAPKEKPKVADPTPYLNHLLYDVMKTGAWGQPIPPQVAYGFANFGQGFYSEFLYSFFYGLNKRNLLTSAIHYPEHLVVERAQGLRWTRPPESGKEQLYHFLFHLRATMKHLAEHPLGTRSTLSAVEVARMLTGLPPRAAFIRSHEEVGVIYTDQTPKPVTESELRKRLYLIRGQTRQRYCVPVESLQAEGPAANPASSANEPPPSRWEEIDE